MLQRNLNLSKGKALGNKISKSSTEIKVGSNKDTNKPDIHH